jgi:hypothetical protein
LNILFKHAPEPVILVVTHSGFARSLLLAVQREPYRPQNAELIPVVVEQRRKKGSGNAGSEDSNDDDSWIDAVLDRHAEQLQESDGKQQEQRADRVVHKKATCFVRRFFAWAMQKMHEARQ